MSGRLEATAERSVTALTGQTDALQARLEAALNQTLGAIASHSDQMTGRLETTAERSVAAFTGHTEALQARLEFDAQPDARRPHQPFRSDERAAGGDRRALGRRLHRPYRGAAVAARIDAQPDARRPYQPFGSDERAAGGDCPCGGGLHRPHRGFAGPPEFNGGRNPKRPDRSFGTDRRAPGGDSATIRRGRLQPGRRAAIASHGHGQ